MTVDIYTVADALTCVFEAIMMFVLLDAFCEKRKNLPEYAYAVGVGVLSILIYISNHLFNFGILNGLGVVVATLCVSAIYNGSLRTKVFITICGLMIMSAIEILILFFITIIFNVTVTEAVNDNSLRLLGIILSKMLTFALASIIRKKVKKREYYIGTSYWILFALIFTTSFVSIFLIFRLLYDSEIKYMNNMSLLCAFGLFLNTFFTLYLYEHMAKQTEIIHRQQQFEQQIKEQSKHLDEMIVSQKQMRKFKHDFSNHMIALSNYFKDKDCKGGLEYITSIDTTFRNNDKTEETGNITLDAIISSKKALAEEKNIDFVTSIQIPEQIPIDAVDLCIIFGNALDNAIEACERIKEGERKISLDIIYEKDSIVCKITNTVNKNEKRTFATTKKDKINHGLGIENIKSSLAKYDCEPEMKRTDSEFILQFIIFTNNR